MTHRPDLGYHDEGQDLADHAFYADATGPAGSARVLPPAAFRSLSYTALEDEAIWTRDWICVGAHEAIPNVGDLLPFTVGTHGLHVQRTEDGLKARFNKAQHGGCRMVPLQCQTGAKTKCSFTSCGYSRDREAIPAGELGDGTPEMHQYLGLRPERLLTADVRSWGPLVFVNLDFCADAPDASLTELNRLGRFFGNDKQGCSAETWLEFPANWKLIGQHLASGEPALEDRDGDWVLATGALSNAEPARLAWLFPNLVLIATERDTCVAILQQTAIGKTLCRIRVYGDASAERVAFWIGEINRRAAFAEQEHLALSRWGTQFRPETLGASLPVQEDPHGHWMQRMLASRVARRGRDDISRPLFQNPRG